MRKKILAGKPAQGGKSDKSPKADQALAKTLGRHTEVSDEELLERLKSITGFLQIEWGKIGYQIQRVGSRDDVVRLLKSTDNDGSRGKTERIIQCLSTPSHLPLDSKSAKKKLAKAAKINRRELKNAENRLNLAWSEYHKQCELVRKSEAALNSAMAVFRGLAHLWPWFCLLYILANSLGVAEARKAHSQAVIDLDIAQDRKRKIAEQLLAEEAALAQHELLEFVCNDRYSGELEHFAEAMAGLPELSWIRSLRRCSKLRICCDTKRTGRNIPTIQIQRIPFVS